VLRDQVANALGRCDLVWLGTRGEDVLSVTDLPQLSAAFSWISALDHAPSVEGMALEDLTGVRVDLDTWDIDSQLLTEPVNEFREAVLHSLSGPSAVFEYRPSAFTSAIAFARQDRCRHLGLFTGIQSAFEHKPWVETSIARLEIPHIPWVYIADIDQVDAEKYFENGPVMLRRSRTTGGVGLVRVDDPDELSELWPREPEAFVSVAPFIDGGISLNVGAVVWDNGVTVHPASVQLIGVPGLTNRPFGYCGNDFAAVADLDPVLLDQMEHSTRSIGAWLGGFGYRGAFGVDFLVSGGEPLFTEINPRFQGSTHASCRLSVDHDESCLVLEHVAAFLELEAPTSVPLRLQAARYDPLSHVVVHNGGPDAGVDPGPLLASFGRTRKLLASDVLTRPELITRSDAAIGRFTLACSVLDTDGDLHPTVVDALASASESTPERVRATTA